MTTPDSVPDAVPGPTPRPRPDGSGSTLTATDPAVDPDALWKPGYAGPAPSPDRSPLGQADHHDHESDPPSAGRRRWPTRRRRSAIVGVGALVVLLAVAVIVSRDASPAADSEVDGVPADASGDVAERDPREARFGGPAGGRLPTAIPTRWTVDLPAADDHWIEVVDDDLVLVARSGVDGGVAALDAGTGTRRWTFASPEAADALRFVGAVDDIVVLDSEGESTLLGIDARTGAVAWSVDAPPNGGHVALAGTRVVARLPVAGGSAGTAPSSDSVALLDAASGAEVAVLPSDRNRAGVPAGWSTSADGTWYIATGSELWRVAGLADDTPRPAAVPVATIGAEAADVAVLDREAVAIDGDGSLVLVALDGDESAPSSGPMAPGVLDLDLPGAPRAISTTSASTFVLTVPGAAVGVEVADGAARTSWMVGQGAVVASYPRDQGTVLQIATRGGAAMQLVDGVTGDTLEHLTMAPSALQSLAVTGEDIVVLQTSEFGPELVALDVTGRERWTIGGATPVAVGDGVVARAVTPTDAGPLRVSAFGS